MTSYKTITPCPNPTRRPAQHFFLDGYPRLDWRFILSCSALLPHNPCGARIALRPSCPAWTLLRLYNHWVYPANRWQLNCAGPENSYRLLNSSLLKTGSSQRPVTMMSTLKHKTFLHPTNCSGMPGGSS